MQEQSFGFIPFFRDKHGLEVLLIHQYGSGGDTLWTFPKGRSEEGETSIQTALREMNEEVGLSIVSCDTTISLSISYAFVRNGVRVEKTTTYFIGFVSEKNFTPQPEEIKEAMWFSIEEAREQLTFPDYKKLLDEAIEILDK